MFSMTYASSASAPFTDDDIEQILSSSRTNNQSAGITGILLYADGNIIQVLEGDETQVRDTYRRIERDSRHQGVYVLLQENVSERAFPEWTMGFKEMPKALLAQSGINQFFSEAQTQTSINRKNIDLLLNNFKTITAS